jgi:hypothetical protein
MCTRRAEFSDASTFIDISRIYKMFRSDHLPFVKVGGDILFDRHEIDRRVAKRQPKS